MILRGAALGKGLAWRSAWEDEVRTVRIILLLTAAVACGAVGGDLTDTARAAQLGKPRPAPDAPPDVPPLPPAIYDGTLAIGGEDVEAKKVQTRLSVKVRLNGTGPYDFVVDSGADTSVVGLRIARNLALPVGTPVVVNAMTARHIVDRVKVAELSIGSTSFRNMELPALKETDVGGDGLIGIDALVEQRLLMDFDKKTIKVEDSRTAYQPLPGEIVITARRKRGQLILTKVKAAGVPLDAVIDTGSEVTIGNTKLRDKLIRGNRNKFWDVEATGVTGVTIKLKMAVIAQLELGPVTLRNVPMAFADVPPFDLFGLSGGPALLLGTDMLENFRRISLDFGARKIRFQLKKCSTEGVVLSTSPNGNFSRLSSTGQMDVCGH
ncbi:MAG TPA: retroviral-like aspartic protease family protein [Sphingomicrobium sp.]|nr:retroviral-like aspartic protease family protein [Sphingomicrobium sp.]